MVKKLVGLIAMTALLAVVLGTPLKLVIADAVGRQGTINAVHSPAAAAAAPPPAAVARIPAAVARLPVQHQLALLPAAMAA